MQRFVMPQAAIQLSLPKRGHTPPGTAFRKSLGLILGQYSLRRPGQNPLLEQEQRIHSCLS